VKWRLLGVLLWFTAAFFVSHAQSNAPVRIIFDTDFAPDVDDVGALAILHVLANQGATEILGVVLSSTDVYAARAVDTINTYYGRPDIPIGVPYENGGRVSSPYTFELAADFENDLVGAPDSVALYRELLAGADNQSITIVSVGFLNNLARLLESSPDEWSPLDGKQLVTQKVKQLVVMGGHYPDSAEHPDGKEYNFAYDPLATLKVATWWTTPIVFAGFETGVDIMTGAVLQTQTSEGNPVRRAYLLYTGGDNRNSWDLVAVLFAVRGEGTLWTLSDEGINEIGTNGSNLWSTRKNAHHRYLIQVGLNTEIERVLDELLVVGG
jgi:inosine-uridine nucleoside N-ribohydrolase